MYSLVHWISDYVHPKGFKIDRPSGNNMYTLLLFKQPVWIWQDNEIVYADESSCIIYSKWAPQLYYNDESDYRHDGIFFDGDDPSPLLDELSIPINHIFHVQNTKAISEAIKEIAGEAMLKETYTPQILDLRIKALLYKLGDLVLHSDSYVQRYFKELQQIRYGLFRHPGRQWNSAELAEDLHISLSRFQHLYKSIFGSTLTQDLIQSRVEHAQYLLKSTFDTAAEIAVTCGYNCEEHFLRQFKTRSGITPSEYRKKYALQKGINDS